MISNLLKDLAALINKLQFRRGRILTPLSLKLFLWIVNITITKIAAIHLTITVVIDRLAAIVKPLID